MTADSLDKLRALDCWLSKALESGVVDEPPSGVSRAEAERMLADAGMPLSALACPPARQPEFGRRLAESLARADGVGPGVVIGPFRIDRLIGSGGMGVVYEARRVEGGFEQVVALKILGGARPDESTVSRFAREREILSRLEHPGIARLIDGGLTRQGRPWFAMEYIEGQRIDEHCAHQRLTIQQRITLFRQVCDALDYAHGQMVLHRDVKPANILVDQSGRVRLVDFGLGGIQADLATGKPEATQLSRRWLTPEYASPEQLNGQDIDVRSEVYQLGLVLYRLLSADSPHEATSDSPADWIKAVTEDEPTAPSDRWQQNGRSAGEFGSTPKALRRRLRGDIDQIVLKALRKEPGRRYASARALGDDLQRYLDGRPVEARPDGLGYRISKFIARHPLSLTALVAAIVLGSSAVVVHVDRLETERDRAQREAARAGMVTEFLVDLFEAADPAENAGGEMRVKAILEEGGRRLDSLQGVPAMRAEMANVLSRVHWSLGDYEAARELGAQSVADNRAMGDAHGASLARSLNTLGLSLQSLRRLDEALALHEEALMIAGALEPADPGLTAETFRSIGITHQLADAYPASLDAFESALAIYETDIETYGVPLAETLDKMAFTVNRMGDPGRALELRHRALALLTRALGDNHPQTLFVRLRIAAIERVLGHFDRAAEQLRSVLADMESVYGDSHPRIALGYFELGHALYLDEEYHKAQSAWETSLALHQAFFEPDHSRIASVLQGLAAIARQQGRLERAESLLQRVLAISESWYGAESLALAAVLNNLGTIQADRGNYDDALDYYRQSLSIYRNKQDAESYQIAGVLHRMGEVHTEMGEYERARQLLEQALAIRESVYSEEHPEARNSRRALRQLAEAAEE